MKGPGIPVLIAISMFIGVAMADEDTEFNDTVQQANMLVMDMSKNEEVFLNEQLSNEERCRAGYNAIRLIKEYGKIFFLYREKHPDSRHNTDFILSHAVKVLTKAERDVKQLCKVM